MLEIETKSITNSKIGALWVNFFSTGRNYSQARSASVIIFLGPGIRDGSEKSLITSNFSK